MWVSTSSARPARCIGEVRLVREEHLARDEERDDGGENLGLEVGSLGACRWSGAGRGREGSRKEGLLEGGSRGGKGSGAAGFGALLCYDRRKRGDEGRRRGG